MHAHHGVGSNQYQTLPGEVLAAGDEHDDNAEVAAAAYSLEDNTEYEAEDIAAAFDPDLAPWVQAHIHAADIPAWKAREFDISSAVEAQWAGFGPYDAPDWARHGSALVHWKSYGFHGQEIIDWHSACGDPSRAAGWRDAGYNIDDAAVGTRHFLCPTDLKGPHRRLSERRADRCQKRIAKAWGYSGRRRGGKDAGQFGDLVWLDSDGNRVYDDDRRQVIQKTWVAAGHSPAEAKIAVEWDLCPDDLRWPRRRLTVDRAVKAHRRIQEQLASQKSSTMWMNAEAAVNWRWNGVTSAGDAERWYSSIEKIRMQTDPAIRDWTSQADLQTVDTVEAYFASNARQGWLGEGYPAYTKMVADEVRRNGGNWYQAEETVMSPWRSLYPEARYGDLRQKVRDGLSTGLSVPESIKWASLAPSLRSHEVAALSRLGVTPEQAAPLAEDVSYGCIPAFLAASSSK